MSVVPRRPLTNMQHVVAECLGRGLSYTQAAKELGIAESTIRTHVQSIATLLPNPDGLKASRLVFLWAAEQRWVREHRVATKIAN